jgi:hypothetical protein
LNSNLWRYFFPLANEANLLQLVSSQPLSDSFAAALCADRSQIPHSQIKVNSTDPGFTATDINQHRGEQTVNEGAIEPVRLALLGDDRLTGGFFEKNGENPW